MSRIFYKDLLQFHREVLAKTGLDEDSVEAVTIGLCETSLRGVDSHGVRLLPHYVRSALSGRKNPRPTFKFLQRYPAVGLLDADNAFGHAAGMKAIDYCMEMADKYGIGVVGVRNSSHAGAMASFALKAARQGYIAFAFTHADSLLLSYNGKRPYFGTNPICIAVPREEDEPYCLDMATSMISWNKLLLYKAHGEALPKNLAADQDGHMTENPNDAVCLLPAGSYKGYGLASMVEILCGIFTGMAFGRNIPAMYTASMVEQRHLGQFYMAMKTDGCIDASKFIHNMQRMTDEVRREPARPREKVMLPGDPQIHETKSRLRDGIPLDPTTEMEFKKLSEKFNVPLKIG